MRGPLGASRSACVDLEIGEVTRLCVVTDSGAACKSDAFWRLVQSRPELEHIRTRHYAPETNWVVERFNESLKYEHLYRCEIDQAATQTEEGEAFLELYNRVGPHESLGRRRHHAMHRADPRLFQALSLQHP